MRWHTTLNGRYVGGGIDGFSAASRQRNLKRGPQASSLRKMRNREKVRNLAKLSERLEAYIRYRTAKEGVEYYYLSPQYFKKALLLGCEKFFGVEFLNGELISDEQFSAIFQEYVLLGNVDVTGPGRSESLLN